MLLSISVTATVQLLSAAAARELRGDISVKADCFSVHRVAGNLNTTFCKVDWEREEPIGDSAIFRKYQSILFTNVKIFISTAKLSEISIPPIPLIAFEHLSLLLFITSLYPPSFLSSWSLSIFFCLHLNKIEPSSGRFVGLVNLG